VTDVLSSPADIGNEWGGSCRTRIQCSTDGGAHGESSLSACEWERARGM